MSRFEFESLQSRLLFAAWDLVADAGMIDVLSGEAEAPVFVESPSGEAPAPLPPPDAATAVNEGQVGGPWPITTDELRRIFAENHAAMNYPADAPWGLAFSNNQYHPSYPAYLERLAENAAEAAASQA